MKTLGKIIAVMILSFCICSNAEASEWSSYFKFDWDSISDYAGEKWNDASNYFTDMFSNKNNESNSDDNLPEHLSSNWDKLTGKLDKTLTLRDQHDSLPKSTWNPFKEDQTSNSRRINELLDAALSLLIDGEAGEIRREASVLRDNIEKNRIELDELRNKRINAPEKSMLPWRLTKSKADEKIARLTEEIEVNEEELKKITTKLSHALMKIGLSLDESQTEILLNSVTGDDLMKNVVVFNNVKTVVSKLEELSQNDTNTLSITKKYTGLYLVLNDLLIHTQEELVSKINNEYKPKLNNIINEAEILRKDALSRSNQKIYNQNQRKAFASNAQSNAMTIQVANLYNKLLDSQRDSINTSIKNLKLNRDLAENTYKTVRSSGELRGLIHSGLNVFDAVNDLSIPELKVFESEIMRLEFDEINRRLKQ